VIAARVTYALSLGPAYLHKNIIVARQDFQILEISVSTLVMEDLEMFINSPWHFSNIGSKLVGVPQSKAAFECDIVKNRSVVT